MVRSGRAHGSHCLGGFVTTVVFPNPRLPTSDRRYLVYASMVVVLASLLQLVAGNAMPVPPVENGSPSAARAPWQGDMVVAAGEAEALIRRGELPWWSHPGLRVAPARPFSSLVQWSLSQLGGERWSEAALRWLCWLTFCAAAALLTREVLPAKRALLALAIFVGTRGHWAALGGAHGLSLLLALALSSLALWRHTRALAYRRVRSELLGLALFGLALLAHEQALGLLPIVVAQQIMRDDRSLRYRLVHLSPWLLLCASRVVWSSTEPYGLREAGDLIDPFLTPARSWANLQESVPRMLAEGFWGLPFDPGSRALGWGLAAIVAALLLRGARRGVTDGLFWGACFAAVIVGMQPFQSESVLVPKLGLALGVAEMVSLGGEHWRRAERGAGWLITLALLLGHVVISPTLSVIQVRRERASLWHRMEQAAALWGRAPDDVIVLSAANQPSTLIGSFELATLGKPLLSAASGPLLVRRVGRRALELETTTAGIFSGPLTYTHAASGPDRWQRGDVVTSSRFAVSVRATDFDGPTRFRVLFPRDLAEGAPLFVRATREGFERVPLPEVGEQVIVPAVNPAFAELTHRD